jgi:hypothetical protein
MLRSLLPKAHHKFLSLPVLGPVTDGFDDWLCVNGFTRGSRKFSIRMLPALDANLRRRHVDKVAKLSHPVLQDCWKALMKIYPCGAGTVHTLERYLVVSGLMVDGRQTMATPETSTLTEEYANHLRQVRGFAASTVSSHRRITQCFLQHLKEAGPAVRRIQARPAISNPTLPRPAGA